MLHTHNYFSLLTIIILISTQQYRPKWLHQFLQVFLKYWHSEKLDTRLDQLTASIVTCQRYARGRIGRKYTRSVRERGWKQRGALLEFLEEVEVYNERFYRAMAKLQKMDKERFEAKRRQVCLKYLLHMVCFQMPEAFSDLNGGGGTHNIHSLKVHYCKRGRF